MSVAMASPVETGASTRPPPRLGPPVVGWTLAGLCAVVTVAALAISLRWSLPPPTYGIIVGLSYPVVGGLVVSRQSYNAVGWLLIAIGVIESFAALAAGWAPVALDVGPGALPGGRPAGQVAAWVADGIWIAGHGLLVTFLPLVFPNGRLPSRRWIPVAVFAGVALLVQFAGPLSVLPQIAQRVSAADVYPDERLASALGALGYDLVRAAAVLCVISLLWRLWRLPPHERGPIVWFAAGAVVTVALLLPIDIVGDPVLRQAISLAAILILPLGAVVAIVRHRAYGIDVVLNRTLVYAVLSVVLALVYLASAAFVDLALEGSQTPATIGAAAVTALVLTPLRQRLQRIVDQIMYGTRDEPHRMVSAVGARLEAIAAGRDALVDVAREIADALRLPFVALEANTTDGPRTIASTGTQDAEAEGVPLITNGEQVGYLRAGVRRGQNQLSERDRNALRQVAPIAATALRQIQLSDDLRRARNRLAAALEEERRRIRRDLHDGLGPSLATVVMGLEEARAVHRNDPERTESLLVDLKQQTRRAVEEIRSLVYGLRPPALDELGLCAAVRQLVDGTVGRTGLAVVLDAPESLPDLPAAIEVAAYRIVQEALTNMVRHSGARSATVTVELLHDRLAVEVRDDGCGLPDQLVAGVGLMSMRERAEDIGGLVQILSDGGTAVRAVLPTAQT